MIRYKIDMWQAVLLAVIILMLAVMPVLTITGPVYAWSPGAGQNVVVDNGYSFSGKAANGTERPMLTLTNANAVRLNAPPAGAIFFTVANTERMRISNSGNVGIGDNTPDEGSLIARSVSGTYGILGTSSNGVYGYSSSNIGIWGNSNTSSGIRGDSTNSNGVLGVSSSGTGVYGQSTTGYAGYFNGNVFVTGTINKSACTFKIDHPQDPENKYLIHSVVESPEMMNIYRGNVLLDSNGEAVVQLPSYFEALNRDFAYQLTCIGGFAPVYVASEISGNSFKIAGGKEGMKISWMVTGIRKDAFASAHPIVVEQEKPAGEKGLYLHPVEWGQPEEKGINKAADK